MFSEAARSDFRCLGKRKRIIDIDNKVSNGVFNFGVPKQNLNSSEIAGSFVYQGGLGTPTIPVRKRMRAPTLFCSSYARSAMALGTWAANSTHGSKAGYRQGLGLKS
ncbi:hypothetical protein QOZ99_004335 [Angulomicrobium amanitiforme]|uniref:Uncharacterized protein n=1 Tax=Ancylobacter amanitiformis TaxID=217069 RepID=A0ABU0LXH3_9HYPH|nr:hypothetical protein [Ancylobacter amanitiformis]